MSLQLLVTLQLLVIRTNSYLAIWLVVNVCKYSYLQLEKVYIWNYNYLNQSKITSGITSHLLYMLHMK